MQAFDLFWCFLNTLRIVVMVLTVARKGNPHMLKIKTTKQHNVFKCLFKKLLGYPSQNLWLLFIKIILQECYFVYYDR